MTTKPKPPVMDLVTLRRVAGNSTPQREDNKEVTLAKQMHDLALKSRESSRAAFWNRLTEEIRTLAEQSIFVMNREQVESLLIGADATARLHINHRLKDEGFEIVKGAIHWTC